VQHPSGLWAKDFVGATPDYVEVTCPQCNFTSEDFSIVFRVSIDSLAVNRELVCRGLFNTDGYRFRVLSTGRLAFQTFQAAANQETFSVVGDILIKTWYTIGVTRIGGAVTLYRDGVDVTDAPAVHIDPLTSARGFFIGIYGDAASEPLDGQISAVKVFSYALNPDQQMQQHINLSNNWE